MRTERLEARISGDHKRLFLRAANLSGVSLTDFVVGAVERAAASVVEKQALMELSARDSEAFVSALLSPPAPNANLRAAVRRYKAGIRGRA